MADNVDKMNVAFERVLGRIKDRTRVTAEIEPSLIASVIDLPTSRAQVFRLKKFKSTLKH